VIVGFKENVTGAAHRAGAASRDMLEMDVMVSLVGETSINVYQNQRRHK
jgi:hypothetical protein